MSDFQNESVQAGNDATGGDKIDGIVDQVRADIALGHADTDIAAELLERAKTSGVPLTEDEAGRIASEISGETPA